MDAKASIMKRAKPKSINQTVSLQDEHITEPAIFDKTALHISSVVFSPPKT
jgi:hypothetical protein